MPLSRKQLILGGKKWAGAKKYLAQSGLDKAELEAERQNLLKLAGAKSDDDGRYSSKTLSNSQFSTYLDLLDTVVQGKPNQKRRSQSIIWKINKLGLADAYLNKISRDQFNCSDWQTLPIANLLNLLKTATARSRRKQKV